MLAPLNVPTPVPHRLAPQGRVCRVAASRRVGGHCIGSLSLGGSGLPRSAYPAYDVRVYVDGRLAADGAARFTAGLTPADLEEQVLSIVLGQGKRGPLTPRFLPKHFQWVICLFVHSVFGLFGSGIPQGIAILENTPA